MLGVLRLPRAQQRYGAHLREVHLQLRLGLQRGDKEADLRQVHCALVPVLEVAHDQVDVAVRAKPVPHVAADSCLVRRA
jgi:hypothetical protein